MQSESSMNRAAILAATVILVACGAESSVGPGTTRMGPMLDVVEAGESAVESVTIWPSYELYDGPIGEAAPVAIMSMQALEAQPNIRIGVVPSAHTVHLGATGAWTLIDRPSGTPLLSGTGGTVAVSLASAPDTSYRLQVACASAAGTASLIKRAEALGHVTATEFVAAANCTRIFLGKFATVGTFGVRSAYRTRVIAEGLAGTDSFWKIVSFGDAVYRIVGGARVFDNTNPVGIIATDGGQVTIGSDVVPSRKYRGRADARMNGSGSMAGINELPMEQYLYGVVPRELGPVAFPEFEAQKAQAVAARTYAYRGLGKRSNDGYDLLPTTTDQVYGGFQDEHAVSNAAVNATAGIMAYHQGKLIETLYSSASGGHTSSNEEVYNSAPVPYLRGVPDAQRGTAFDHVPTLEVFRAHANPTSLRNTAENLFESDWSTRERWVFEWTQDEISSIIGAFAGRPVGRVHALNVSSRGPSGRALVIEYVTDSGTFTDRKDRIRSSLKYISASGTRTSLPSTLIFIEPVKEKGALTGGFRVYGGGFGHGVGMSQTGAVGMAQKGRTYEEILKHYYQGIALEAAY